jgi:hypothetical protein
MGRSLAEMWDRQDARECIYYGKIIQPIQHAEVARALLPYVQTVQDNGQVYLAIKYLEKRSV